MVNFSLLIYVNTRQHIFLKELVLQKKYNKEISNCKARETKRNMELRKYTGQLDKLNAEIADSLTGGQRVQSRTAFGGDKRYYREN